MSVYSTRLAERSGGVTSGVNLYTVPVAKVAVIRDVEIVNETVTAGGCQLFAAGAGRPYVLAFHFSSAVALEHQQWQGRWVLNAGEILRYHQDGGATTLDLTVCGYLLDA